MNNPLENIIRQEIFDSGPMDVGRFMALALAHPVHGYYMTRDPFGRGGDFTTAPEISQMFGEMIGVWVVGAWRERGAPRDIVLLECGPGRGTLMADLLRTGGMFPPFLEGVQVHLLEISPVLMVAQAKALAGFAPLWHETLESLPTDRPLFVVANEFLDALPFHQWEKTPQGWQERVVLWDDSRFVFGLKAAPNALITQIPDALLHAPVGAIFEVAPARVDFVREIEKRIKKQGGAALFIDYGSYKSGLCDTFQAVKAQSFTKVLEDVGQCDLTSHVDFGAIKRAVPTAHITTQEEFLRSCGIEERADSLMKKNAGHRAKNIQNDLDRLIDSAHMGELFKVLRIKG